jgi:hypothetical protein
MRREGGGEVGVVNKEGETMKKQGSKRMRKKFCSHGRMGKKKKKKRRGRKRKKRLKTRNEMRMKGCGWGSFFIMERMKTERLNQSTLSPFLPSYHSCSSFITSSYSLGAFPFSLKWNIPHKKHLFTKYFITTANEHLTADYGATKGDEDRRGKKASKMAERWR